MRWLTGSLNGATWAQTVPPLVALVVLAPGAARASRATCECCSSATTRRRRWASASSAPARR